MKSLLNYSALFCLFALLLSLTACTAKQESTADSFTIRLLCESEDVYQIFYSCYLDGEYYGMGGMADFDGRMLSESTPLEPVFTIAYLENRDISHFSIDFSPYGKNDTHEVGTTNRIEIPAEYGKAYTLILSGDRENGFTVRFAE